MQRKQKTEQAETINDLVKLTDKENPKPAHLQRIREKLDEDSTLVRINESGQRAFDAVIRSYTKSALAKELFYRQIKEKRKEMDYDSANVMVRMLIDQVIITKLRLDSYEVFHAAKFQESISFAAGVYWDRLLSNYQRRFQQACRLLALVRKAVSESELNDQQARYKKSQSTLASQRLLKEFND
jgi:hypothetical protein